MGVGVSTITRMYFNELTTTFAPPRKRGSFNREAWELYLKSLAKQKEEEEEKKRERIAEMRQSVDDFLAKQREKETALERIRTRAAQQKAGVLVAVMNLWDDDDLEIWQ